MTTHDLLKSNVAKRKKLAIAVLVSTPDVWRKAIEFESIKSAIDGEGDGLPASLLALRRVEGNIVAGRNGLDVLSWSERSKMVRHFRELCLAVDQLARETKDLKEYETKGV